MLGMVKLLLIVSLNRCNFCKIIVTSLHSRCPHLTEPKSFLLNPEVHSFYRTESKIVAGFVQLGSLKIMNFLHPFLQKNTLYFEQNLV